MPASIPANHVPASQYNSLLTRFDAQVHLCSQLEADLTAARDQIAYLRQQLSSRPTHLQPATPAHSRPQSFTPSSDNTTCIKPATTELHPSQPREQERAPVPPCDSDNRKGHDKEIMSHCSDISASKSAARASDANSIKKSTHRKSSNNLAASNGVTKKSKSKKERAQKAKIPGQSRYWTPDEHKLFLEALNKYGHKDLRSIAAFVGTRNMTQVRTHSQKYFMRLMREAKRQNPVAKRPAATEEEAGTVDNAGSAAATAQAPVTGSQSGDNVAKEETAAAGTLKDMDEDKYSVPNTCGMTLLCLVGQDTLPVNGESR
eukprot:GFKZ01015005.1.p1 GENE.GFKZ01015005.1~~GFKZ01015005.1.p1  ORF type:complete len:356 (-),score=53.22 GFKZ01015005.1:1138-2088(-)